MVAKARVEMTQSIAKINFWKYFLSTDYLNGQDLLPLIPFTHFCLSLQSMWIIRGLLGITLMLITALGKVCASRRIHQQICHPHGHAVPVCGTSVTCNQDRKNPKNDLSGSWEWLV